MRQQRFTPVFVEGAIEARGSGLDYFCGVLPFEPPLRALVSSIIDTQGIRFKRDLYGDGACGSHTRSNAVLHTPEKEGNLCRTPEMLDLCKDGRRTFDLREAKAAPYCCRWGLYSFFL